MRKFILPVLFLHLAFAVNAATYYFSAKSGNDSYTAVQAQNSSTPWKSITKLNSIMLTLKAGDQVLFKRSETFSGALIVAASGTSSAPITFGAWGSGDKPIINGFSVLMNWVNLGGNIWECPFSQSSGTVGMVVKNGKQQAIGRYPNRTAANGGYLIIDSHSGLTQLTSKQLPSSPNWTGADVVIRKNRWVLDRSLITYHSGNTLGFESASDNSITDKYGFFIENSPGTLDQDGEWWYNKNQAKMRMYFADNNPTAYACYASTTEQLVTISFRSYITFDNLVFKGANQYLFNLTNSNNIKINACNLNFSGINAIHGLSSTYVTLSNSTISDANNNGVNLYWNCSNATINNNIVTRTALVPGMSQSGTNAFIGVHVRGDHNLVQYNEIDSSGSNGIHFEGDYSTVQNNFVNYFGLTIDDCGGIYTGQGEGVTTTYNYKGILNNIVVYGIGAPKGTSDTSNTSLPATQGIYLDDNTNHVTVSGNSVAYCGQAGIFPHDSYNIDVLNNTMFNNGKEQLLLVRSDKAASYVNVKGNIMFSKTASQLAVNIGEYTGINDISGIGTIDGNYYCRPLDNNYLFYDMYLSNGNYIGAFDNLNTWRSKFGFDKTSKGAPATIPAFSVSSLSGVNKYTNGAFNTSVGDVGSFSANGDLSTAWVNKLDGGTLQASSKAYVTSNGYMLTLPLNSSITAGKSYQLTFSVQSAGNDAPLTTYIRQNTSPQIDLTTRTQIPLSTTRKEIKLAFTATASSSSAALQLDISSPNGAIWVDNVILQEATVTPTNPDDYILFQYNPSTGTKTVALGGTAYYDAKGATYSGNITLQPYTSIALFKQSGTTVSSAKEVTATQSLNVSSTLVDASAASYTSASSAAVNWQVDNQGDDVSYYQVERSSDNVHFSIIGKAASKSSDGTPVIYQYNDATPAGGKNYYRISQYDAKGTAGISKVTMVNNISFTVNPNPAKDVIHLTFDKTITLDDKVGKEILIRNIAGATVKTVQFPSTSNLNRFDLKVADLQTGAYILSITLEGKTFSRKFLKQ